MKMEQAINQQIIESSSKLLEEQKMKDFVNWEQQKRLNQPKFYAKKKLEEEEESSSDNSITESENESDTTGTERSRKSRVKPKVKPPEEYEFKAFSFL